MWPEATQLYTIKTQYTLCHSVAEPGFELASGTHQPACWAYSSLQKPRGRAVAGMVVLMKELYISGSLLHLGWDSCRVGRRTCACCWAKAGRRQRACSISVFSVVVVLEALGSRHSYKIEADVDPTQISCKK